MTLGSLPNTSSAGANDVFVATLRCKAGESVPIGGRHRSAGSSRPQLARRPSPVAGPGSMSMLLPGQR